MGLRGGAVAQAAACERALAVAQCSGEADTPGCLAGWLAWYSCGGGVCVWGGGGVMGLGVDVQ